MATINLTKDNYESIVSEGGIVIVDCWAAWCGGCKEFSPVYEKVADKFPAHTFGKLDTQAEEELVSALGIEKIPSLLLYRDGILLFKQPGYYEEDKLEDIVRQAESVDMEAVRSHIEAEKNGGEQKQS